MISTLYAAATRWRRRHQGRPLRLAHPVVSIGNLALGGRAKTPMVELVARVLLAAGERPAILSRGYARERVTEAPVIVRDAEAVRAGLAESGDEPLMLAEALDGAIVVVHADRARAGNVAEGLGATVHVLDDGFQHLRLRRDIDIVMLHPRDLDDAVVPGGRLREPLDALASAHAIVLIDGVRNDRSAAALRVAELSNAQVFSAVRRVEPPTAALGAARALLVSGIADSGQLSQSLAAAGWQVASERAFKDHHRYTSADVDDIQRAGASAGAAIVLTTMKDAVRLRAIWRGALPLQAAPMSLAIDGTFSDWLTSRVAHTRAGRAASDRVQREDGARHAS
ncbi:MAG: tetraacyldisaccharide 4'-kinase [Acidobacteriota bacterium]|nr:tetraacyldisaccharide 4'-kinase [Acidobacteriota bacterium]